MYNYTLVWFQHIYFLQFLHIKPPKQHPFSCKPSPIEPLSGMLITTQEVIN